MKRNIPLIIASLYSFQVCSQVNPRNLDFEQTNGYNNNINPWQKTSFSKAKYLITLDSTVQHNGRYSLRFTYDTTAKNISDGGLLNNLALDVLGKKLRFSAYVRQSNPDDTAGTISCIVSQNKGETKVAVRGQSIIHAKDWTLVSREFDLDTFNLPVDHLRLNIIANGKDTFWVDDVKIEIDGTDIYKLPSFASAKNEKIVSLSMKQVENLRYLCYVWGFLKYFHPQVANGRYNWDMELFKMIPLAKKAPSKESLSELLLSWIDSLGEIPTCNNCDTVLSKNIFTTNVDFGWMQSRFLSGELTNRLKYVLANRHTGNGYYAQARPLGNLDFYNEDDYGNWREIGYPNELFRLQFLFRYWNTIQYFYPYKYVIGKDWNAVLKEFIARFAEAKDVTAYHLLMTEFVNSVNDSHSGLTDMIVRNEIAPLTLPVKTTIIDNKAIITSILNDSLAKVSELKVGDVIEKINDQSVKEIIDKYIQLVNGSNYSVKIAYMNAYNYITGGRDSLVKLTLNRSGKYLSVTTKRYSQFPVITKKDTTQWTILPGNIGFVNMGLLEEKGINKLFAELSSTKAIIFDLRHYPKGTVLKMCKYLYAIPTKFAKILKPNLNYPGTFLWEGDILYGPGSGDRGYFPYKGKVVMLVNENTQSQAEWTTMAFQAIPGSVTIGSQTSGADGDVSHLYLTGNYHTNMTGLGVFYPDGTVTQRTGIKIDIIVHPTINGIQEQRDEILEKAIEYINRKM